jgi:hypothetical protein
MLLCPKTPRLIVESAGDHGALKAPHSSGRHASWRSNGKAGVHRVLRYFSRCPFGIILIIGAKLSQAF